MKDEIDESRMSCKKLWDKNPSTVVGKEQESAGCKHIWQGLMGQGTGKQLNHAAQVVLPEDVPGPAHETYEFN